MAMPMKPSKGESQSDFMKRCVPEMMGDGKRDNEQAVAACMTMFRDKDKQKQIEPSDDEDYEDFILRCEDSGEDSEECRLIWAERRSDRAVVKFNDGRRGIRKTHSEPATTELEFVMSDETVDRMGDVIMSNGWDLSDFQKNSVCLFNHNPNFVLGSWTGVQVKDGRLRGKLRLLKEGKSIRIDEIRALIDEGHLKTTSVGFSPVESEPLKSGDPLGGYRFKRQKLVECSICSVPANPNALAIAKSLNLHDDTIALVFAKSGSRDARDVGRRSSTGKPAEIPPISRNNMSLSQRIKDSEGRVVVYRDKLTEHLKAVDDSNVSDAELEVTNELNGKIRQEEKALATLKESEKNLLQSSDADNEADKGSNGSTVLRAATRPFGIKPKQVAPIEYLVRDGVVQLFAHRHKRDIDAVRKSIYGDDEATKAFIEYSAKAATAPAMTTTTGWAAELVQQVNAAFMEPLHPNAVFPPLSDMGLSLSFGRNGRIAVPTRSLTPTIAGSFVGEGAPIPVRQGAFTAAILTPKKMAVITTWTREIDEHSVPAIEGLLRDAIQTDTAVSIDSVLLDANAATAIRPAGLLNGVAGLTPTAGGGFNAVVADLKQLSGALMTGTAGNVRKMVWLMNPQQRLSLSLVAAPGAGMFPFKEEVSQGKLLGYAIIESGTVPLGTVIVLDAADFVSVGGEAPRFEISDQATLHMEDTAPLPLAAAGTPATVAAPARSLFQTDSMALRLILPLNWTLRRTGVVAWVAGVTW